MTKEHGVAEAIAVRPARIDDQPAIVAVLADTFESMWKPVVTDAAASLFPDRSRSFVAEHGPDMWVAEVEGAVAGLVYWRDDFVHSLHVMGRHARLGLGGRLLDVAEAAIAEAGFAAARLETDTFNLASQRFYAARGYREAGRYPDEEWNSALTTLLLIKVLT